MEALGQTSFRLFLGRMFLILIDAHSNGLRLSVLPLLLQLLQWTAYVKVLNNLSFQRLLQRAMALASPVRNLSLPQEQMAFVVWLWCHTTQLSIDMQKVPSKMWSKGWRRSHKVLWLHVYIAKVLFNYRLTPQGTTSISPAELLLGWRPRSKLDPGRPT